jgi:uncharacterized damage-inducible protein DinB
MKEKYNLLYKQHEQLKIKLFAELQMHSDEVINKKPSAEAWSVADIIAHLIAGEEYVFNYVSKKIKEGKSGSKTGFLAQAKRNILKIAFALPIKFKVPKSVTPVIEYITLKDLEAKWNNASKAMHNLLNSLEESEFAKDIWKHPRVGKINFVQMIDFSIDHFKRHEGQIKRTLAALKKQ